MTDAERAEMIRQNPDYGVIVCRCEEISRGEILDALRSPICVPTLTFVIKIENTAEVVAPYDGCGASCARFKTAKAVRSAPEAPR